MARAGWANCRTLQSGLQVPHGTQSLLGDFGIGVSAHFFQVGDAVFVSTHREDARQADLLDRKSTRLNSSHLGISYAVFCLKKKKESHHKHDLCVFCITDGTSTVISSCS